MREILYTLLINMMSSALPYLSMKKIEIPRPASQIMSIKSRSIGKSGQITATMPRTNNTASSSPAPEYLEIERKDRISYENKIDDLLRGVSFRTVEPETIPGLIIVLKERKRKAIMNSNYTLSQTIDNMIGQLNSILIQKKHEAIRAQQIKENEGQIILAKKHMDALVAKWEEKIKQFTDEQSEASKKLEDEHVKELSDFEKNILRQCFVFPNELLVPFGQRCGTFYQ